MGDSSGLHGSFDFFEYLERNRVDIRVRDHVSESQARFFCGLRALSLCLSEGLPLRQGLAYGRQFLQGFGLQK